MYSYKYVGNTIIDLPTIGKRNIKNGDMIETDTEINNSLFEKQEQQSSIDKSKIENEIKQEESKIEALKAEEGSVK